MNALINETEDRNELLELLREKIEMSISEDNLVIVSIESPIMNLLKTFWIEQYTITDQSIYLDSDITLNIMMNEVTEFTYQEDYEGEYFKIIYKEIEIRLYFL